MSRFNSFAEFYPFYLSEHRHPTCRRLHFVGSSLAIACVLAAILDANAWWIAGALVAGYGFAWTGHAFFEHNRRRHSSTRSTALSAIGRCTGTC